MMAEKEFSECKHRWGTMATKRIAICLDCKASKEYLEGYKAGEKAGQESQCKHQFGFTFENKLECMNCGEVYDTSIEINRMLEDANKSGQERVLKDTIKALSLWSTQQVFDEALKKEEVK